MIIYRSDFGWFGFICSLLVHIQIYILLFVMQCCAAQVDDIQKRIKRQREQDRGSYNGVELGNQSQQKSALSYTLSDGSQISSSPDNELLKFVAEEDPEVTTKNEPKKLVGSHYLDQPEDTKYMA
jgi:hypothetical protein